MEDIWDLVFRLATLRRDGFVSLDAGETEGYMLTKLLTIDGGELHLNIDASQGYVIVSVTDDIGTPLESYTSLQTKLLTIDGGELHLNIDASQGYVIVSVTDDIGTPLESYTSLQVVGDQLDVSVEFDQTLEALSGKEVRLRFQLKNASLYSYWFV